MLRPAAWVFQVLQTEISVNAAVHACSLFCRSVDDVVHAALRTVSITQALTLCNAVNHKCAQAAAVTQHSVSG